MSDAPILPDAPADQPDRPSDQAAYRVLARKYRPARFADLIGQETLVQTLTNAFAMDRLAHAFLLTGVRGVGKTTTARLIARAINCIGDGTGTDGRRTELEPCGTCANCTQIASDRHPDVLEMDAASRTGVDDIRELIEGVRYAPTSAPSKVYIIDEVHMLSVNAFNALLKTLEEPPDRVTFIFATTDPRKLPVTVISRCQRFDLRRVDRGVLSDHFTRIAQQESASIEPGAVALIARAADGSVRDGLSLLDQAIGHAAGAMVTETAVRDMLGLADRAALFDLYEAVIGDRLPDALETLTKQYQAGADPVVVVQDLLEIVHWLTRLKIVPTDAVDPGLSPDRRERGGTLADKLRLPALTRDWQILLKGLQETMTAPDPLQAVEMVLIRLAYAAELPTPADLVKKLSQSGQTPAAQPQSAPSERAPAPTSHRASAPIAESMSEQEPPPHDRPPHEVPSDELPSDAPPPNDQPPHDLQAAQAPPPRYQRADRALRPTSPLNAPKLRSFEQVVDLFAERREAILQAHLTSHVHLVRFEPGRIEIRPQDAAPRSLAGDVAKLLSDWTGERWLVIVSGEEGAPTLTEARDSARAERIAAAERHPAVRTVLEAFPKAHVTDVRETRPQSTDDEPPLREETGDRTG